jgi:hypothetical protein
VLWFHQHDIRELHHCFVAWILFSITGELKKKERKKLGKDIRARGLQKMDHNHHPKEILVSENGANQSTTSEMLYLGLNLAPRVVTERWCFAFASRNRI